MNLQPNDTALITGATGGLGVHIVRAFSQFPVRLALTAYPGNDMDELCAEAAKHGREVAGFVSDLRDRGERRRLVETILKRFGRVDVLVNNAGVEFNSFYHELLEENVLDVLSVNLEAPLILTRMLLPQMLERRRGHVVNISSLAGKSGPAFQEPYAASKAGLVAFTASLRATYRGTGVSASAIVPGFVDTGIYTRLQNLAGRSAPALLKACPPEWVARAIIRAIRRDTAETIISRYPVRPILALSALSPALGDWLTAKIGTHDFFRAVVKAQKNAVK